MYSPTPILLAKIKSFTPLKVQGIRGIQSFVAKERNVHSCHEYRDLVRKISKGEVLDDTDFGVLSPEQTGLPGFGKAIERG